jgi:hypothetical protein
MVVPKFPTIHTSTIIYQNGKTLLEETEAASLPIDSGSIAIDGGSEVSHDPHVDNHIPKRENLAGGN